MKNQSLLFESYDYLLIVNNLALSLVKLYISYCFTMHIRMKDTVRVVNYTIWVLNKVFSYDL
jgi:hypothetical protein